MRLLIADDIAPVRHELRQLLDLTGRVQVVGEAADGAQAVRLALELRPDVILMDLQMPLLDGFAAAAQIKAALPACRVIALSIHEDSAARRRALEAGMDAFIPKGASFQELLDAIQNNCSPNRLLEPEKGE